MSSTPDIVFASHGLANTVVRYTIHIVDYGSDYKGIMLETSILLDNHMEKERRRLYYNVDWEAIRVALAGRVATILTISPLDTIDRPVNSQPCHSTIGWLVEWEAINQPGWLNENDPTSHKNDSTNQPMVESTNMIYIC
jgi:hypothetical protein